VTLSTPGTLAVTRRIDVRLSLLRDARPLRHGARVRVHHGTDEVIGRVAVAAVQESASPEWRRIEAGERAVTIPAGSQAFVRLRLERPAVLTRGDRVVLRAYSPAATIGGCLVLDPEPPRSGVRRAATFDRFRNMVTPLPGAVSAGPDQRFADVWLVEAGLKGIATADLVRRGGLDLEAAARLTAALAASGRAVHVGGRLFPAEAVGRIGTRLIEELERFHDQHPIETGVPRETLREVTAPGAPPDLFDAIVKDLAGAGQVVGTDKLALPARGDVLDPESARARDAVERHLRDAGLTPPDAAALGAAARVAPATLDQVVRLLVRERRAVRVGGLLFHADVLARLRADIRGLNGRSGQTPTEVDVATFKERYGLTRKFAIPLLEWLDRERVTRRVGERRIIL
jgi:selenocysteine-specific elongation factor